MDAYDKAVEMVEEFDEMCKAEFPLYVRESYARIAHCDDGDSGGHSGPFHEKSAKDPPLSRRYCSHRCNIRP